MNETWDLLSEHIPGTVTHTSPISATWYKNFPWPARNPGLPMDADILSHLYSRRVKELSQTWNLCKLNRETTRRHIISVELSHLWEAKRSLVTEEFLHLLCSWDPATCSYPETYESSTHPLILFLRWILILYYLPCTPRSTEQTVAFWSLTKTAHAFFCPMCVPCLWDEKETDVKHCLPQFIHVNYDHVMCV
jgi:hypothetical protein